MPKFIYMYIFIKQLDHPPHMITENLLTNLKPLVIDIGFLSSQNIPEILLFLTFKHHDWLSRNRIGPFINLQFNRVTLS